MCSQWRQRTVVSTARAATPVRTCMAKILQGRVRRDAPARPRGSPATLALTTLRNDRPRRHARRGLPP